MHILDSRKVKTRKPHMCHGCQQLIPANTENVDTQTVAYDGTVHTNYNCKRCDDWIKKNRDYFNGEWYEGDIREAMKETGEWEGSICRSTKISRLILCRKGAKDMFGGKCKVCGCTNDNACLTERGPCWWTDEFKQDLCSACVDEDSEE